MPPLLVAAAVIAVVVLVLQVSRVLTGPLSLVASLVYVGLAAYALAVVWVAFVLDRGPTLRDRLIFFLVLPSMHLSWGTGFIQGLLRGGRDIIDTSRSNR
jgi:hypothetical protein